MPARSTLGKETQDGASLLGLYWIVEYNHPRKGTRESEEIYTFKSAVNYFKQLKGQEPVLYEVELQKRKLM